MNRIVRNFINVESAKIETFYEFLLRKNPTWMKVINALNAIGENDVAKQIYHKYFCKLK